MLRALLFVGFLVIAPLAAAELKVGISPDYPPLAFRQEGQLVGVEADNVRAVGEMLNQDIKLVEMPFNELIPALEQGRVDIVMSGMSITDERAKRVLFCEPYMQIGQMAIAHRDRVGDFAQPWAIYREGVRVGVEPGTTGADFAETELTEAEVKPYADPPAAFAALRRGEIDLYVHDAPTSWLLATSEENGDLISLYQPLTEERLAWAVRQGDAPLLAELNTALATMKANGTLRYILNRWIPVTIEVR